MSDKQLQNSFTTEYKQWLNEIKQKFQSSQIKASIQVNSTLLEFYWNLGNEIVEKQKNSTWGSGFLQQLSIDLSAEFPDVKGFSYTNIKNIRQWFLFWQQAVGELESTENITKFLLELGSGFAFVGRQYKLIVGGDEFRIDLLFYHIKLKCYVVVELKATEFKPEFAGKLSFYTSAVDGEIKDINDNPTIGILICKSKNDLVVEYALKDINKPLGISQYELTEILPKEYKSSLPSIEEIEAQFQNEDLKAVGDE